MSDENGRCDHCGVVVDDWNDAAKAWGERLFCGDVHLTLWLNDALARNPGFQAAIAEAVADDERRRLSGEPLQAINVAEFIARCRAKYGDRPAS